MQVDNNIRQKMTSGEKKDISEDGSDELSNDEETGNSEESVTSEIISNETMENLSTRKPLACMQKKKKSMADWSENTEEERGDDDSDI